MINLKLDNDEGILLQTTEVEHYGEQENSLDDFILTNKHLIYSYEFRERLFSKAEVKVEKIPLDKIKVVNGNVQVMHVNHESYGDVMQVFYTDGRREFFSFYDEKREIPKWINAIHMAITGDDASGTEEVMEKQTSGLFFEHSRECAKQRDEDVFWRNVEQREKNVVDVTAGGTAFATNLMNVMDLAAQKIDDIAKQVTEYNTGSIKSENVQSNTEKIEKDRHVQVASSNRFCVNCGVKLQEESKFCHSCGCQIGQGIAQATQDEDVSQKDMRTRAQEYGGTGGVNAVIDKKWDTSQRKEIYEGEIHKCPQCGEVLKALELCCSACGYEIRGNHTSSNIIAFVDELDRLEADGGQENHQRIVNRIRNFPVPTNKEDLYEFIILAASNIREDRYKDDTSQTKKDISDAWSAKFEQAYQKAKITLKVEDGFDEVQELYLRKNTEQKRAKMRSAMLLPVLLVVTFVIVFGMWGAIFAVDNVKIQKENERLEVIVQQIYEHIEAEEYSMARSKASLLVFSGSTSMAGEQNASKWDITRYELFDIIDRAEYGADYVPKKREIRLGVSQDDLKGDNYQDVKKLLKNRGFTNIKVEEYKDLSTGWWTYEGVVEKVSIDGEMVFSEDSAYYSDVEIIIYYHSLEE